ANKAATPARVALIFLVIDFIFENSPSFYSSIIRFKYYRFLTLLCRNITKLFFISLNKVFFVIKDTIFMLFEVLERFSSTIKAKPLIL
ncbi:hypothetical protein, partial [Streptococcus pneumoniae]|uniref:hypothetical protein n=1 Tax=Streptococcus pneumoniae TaxID=1313 RepID=UPI001C53F33D